MLIKKGRKQKIQQAEETPYDPTKDPDCNLISEDVQSAIDELCEKNASVVDKLLDFIFSVTGNASNKWMTFSSSSSTSDEVPLVTPFDGNLIGLAYSNQKDNSEADIEIYVNGVLQYTWEVRDKRTAWKTDMLVGVLNAGDRVSAFIRKVGAQNKTPDSPVIEVLYSIDTATTGEGGTSSGV